MNNISGAGNTPGGVQQTDTSKNINSVSPLELVAVSLTAAMDVMTNMTTILSNISQGLSKSMTWLQNIENQLIDLSSVVNNQVADGGSNTTGFYVNTTPGSLYYDLCLLMPTNPDTWPPTSNNQPAIGTGIPSQGCYWSVTSGDIQEGISVVQGDITNLGNRMNKIATFTSQVTSFYSKLENALSSMIKSQSQTLQSMGGNI